MGQCRESPTRPPSWVSYLGSLFTCWRKVFEDFCQILLLADVDKSDVDISAREGGFGGLNGLSSRLKMARALRIQEGGAWYHLTARGNERRPIYRDQRDRHHFRELLAELVERYRWRMHVYVLMDNHYHLVAETAEANLSRGMQWLNVSYSVWFNRRHKRAGHLFQGRYGSIVVDRLDWGLEVSRYVHLNPVRLEPLGLGKAQRQRDRLGIGAAPPAELVRERIRILRQYRWSSYRAYVGLEEPPEWLTCQSVRELIGGTPGAKQRQAYREHVESAVRQGLPESPWDKVVAQAILGGPELVRTIRESIAGNEREQPGLKQLAPRPKLEDVIRETARLKGEPWENFRDRYGDSGRDIVLWFGRKRCGLTLEALARHVGGLDYSSVSLAIKRLEQRRRSDNNLQRLIEQVDEALQV